MTGSIYCIHNTRTGKRYVGSSNNHKKRKRSHELMLNNGSHHSYKLQLAWHGEDCFEFYVLERHIHPDHLIQREQHWINFFNSAKEGYNVLEMAGQKPHSKKAVKRFVRSPFGHRRRTSQSVVRYYE